MVEASVYSSLPDPFKDRQVSEKQCPSLINQPLSDTQLFKLDIPDWKMLKEFMQREGPVSKP
jgi:serine/threonine-protein phosphatase 2B catalytic subunit